MTRSGSTRPISGNEQHSEGFIRTLLAGTNGRLSQAFDNAWTSPHTSRVEANDERGVTRFLVDRNLPNSLGSYELFNVRDQIRVVIEDVQDTGPRLERAPGENLISFRIQLAGEFIAGIGDSNPVHFHCPHLGARFQPRGTSLRLFFPPSRVARSVTLFCTPQFLMGNLVTDRHTLPAQAQRLLTASAPDFSYCRLTVTSEIIACASALLNNPVSGLLRLPYAEAKILELLTLCVAAFGRLEEAAVQQFSETDIRRFHRAREILATKFSPPPTIASLARELGINETKLKSGFKALFGHTVFEYGHECRMQHAVHLLRDKRIRISKVAEAVGYQHQGTFASAFKAHFGVRPKDVRLPPSPEVGASQEG